MVPPCEQLVFLNVGTGQLSFQGLCALLLGNSVWVSVAILEILSLLGSEKGERR